MCRKKKAMLLSITTSSSKSNIAHVLTLFILDIKLRLKSSFNNFDVLLPARADLSAADEII